MDILIEEFEEKIWSVALENGRLEGLEIDPSNETVRYGSIYWAKVSRIDKALDAAFLELDGESMGILFNADCRFAAANGGLQKGGDKAIGKTLSPGDMVPVQAKSGYIEDLHGSILQSEDKIARMSMDITIQGRYLIYCAMMNSNRISQRIRGKELRAKLDKMVQSIEDMQGLILRSAAADMQTEILQREARILKEMWLQISSYFEGNDPTLIALGPDSIQRILSDKAAGAIDRIEIVTMDHFEQVEEWCSIFAPDLMTKITPVEMDDGALDLALLEYRDLLGQIESLFHNYVLLSTGGSLIIQPTAAMTVIDVNSGSDKRSRLAVNIDAAHEIARQMRLRNLGGIVLVDFLKVSKKDEKALLKTLDEQTYTDPCTVQIHGFTKLGLMEITRKRRTPPLDERVSGIDF